MDDNSSSDDEMKDTPMSPALGGKKLKLNDGSSQDSLRETATSNKGEKDENVDSGVSADKSESTSSDDRAAGTSEVLSNVFVNAAPSSSSNVRAILLNFSRTRRMRSYRKWKTPDRNTDSNDSSRDSDDLSGDENRQGVAQPDTSNSEADSEEFHRFMLPFSDRSHSGSSSIGDSSSDTNDNYESDLGGNDMGIQNSGDTDSDDEEAYEHRSNMDNEDDKKIPSVLQKTRPKHNYQVLKEVIKREMGFTFPCGKTTKNDVMFERKFYGSLHAVYRLSKLHHLNKHKGCVNSIHFHPEGHLLASGSDDTNVIVWDWARNIPLHTIRTGHKANVFQSKFLHLNARSQLNIVTCARDGQVRLLQCPPSGGSGGGASRRRLAAHARAAHKLHVCAAEPHLVISAGEDGLVMHCDVRADRANMLFHVKEKEASIPLYSVCGHPLEPRELMVAGRDRFVRVYDRRRAARPLALYSPTAFNDHNANERKRMRMSMMHLTCAVYNHDGSEILGSYNDEDIYLFDAKRDVYDKDSSEEKDGYTHKYCGHRNSATFKGVAFFGPKSEYIVSGSDCSFVYIWEKKSEAIVQWMRGDNGGVVNCIESHPRAPVLATSGLDKDVKIWTPTRESDPKFDGLSSIVRDNSSQMRSPLFNDFLPTLYSTWRDNRLFSDDDDGSAYVGGNVEMDGGMCTTF